MATGLSSASCEHCRFYDDHKVNGGIANTDAGLCRFNPPISQPDPKGQGLWPVVAAKDWCGHFASDMAPGE